MAHSSWQPVVPGLWMYRDSCSVYAFEAPEGIVCINAGTGQWLNSVGDLPAPVVAVLCTHYFRDHSTGASAAARAGAKVFVPEYELEAFADPEQHFRQRETYIVYDNIWDRFSPIEPIPVEGVLQDYAKIDIAGAEFEVIPLPGATPSQIGLGVTLKDGRRAVFSGETIHSPGRVPRIAPFQYNYNDLSGAANCYYSASLLETMNPDVLLPSLGDPIVGEVGGALAALKTGLWSLMAVRPGMTETIDAQKTLGLERITDHVWLDCNSVANTWYVVSESGKVLAIDYGYPQRTAWTFPGYPKRAHRRALLHGIDALKSQFGIDRIDVVLVSHFHDDHVCGIPVLQRVQGTECWAADCFADLLEFPKAHTFPCNWPIPSRVHRRLPMHKPFHWEEYTFHLAPMSGHTRFAALIGFEADGIRFAHTGDQYFFVDTDGGFQDNRRYQNQVYRNGALLDGYEQSGKWMLEWRPEIVLQGHQKAMHTDDHFFRHIEEWSRDYADLARDVMPLADTDAHFDLDSWGGWIWPYRVHLAEAQPFTIRATVRNPFPDGAELTVRLVGPANWNGETKTLRAEGRREVSCELSMRPEGRCRRQPIAVDLTANGRPFGQVAEALVTVGHPFF